MSRYKYTWSSYRSEPVLHGISLVAWHMRCHSTCSSISHIIWYDDFVGYCYHTSSTDFSNDLVDLNIMTGNFVLSWHFYIRIFSLLGTSLISVLRLSIRCLFYPIFYLRLPWNKWEFCVLQSIKWLKIVFRDFESICQDPSVLYCISMKLLVKFWRWRQCVPPKH
jgi:hypothetical protein